MKKALLCVALLGVWMSSTAQMCTKEIVFSKDFYTQPKTALYETDRASVLQAAQKTLEQLGYAINQVDDYRGRIITGWRPVESDSHYANLFERRDYGVSDGAYYQLIVDLSSQGSKIKVAVSTTVKTIAGKLESSGKVEKRILARLDDQLRSPQIHMSNVGVKNR